MYQLRGRVIAGILAVIILSTSVNYLQSFAVLINTSPFSSIYLLYAASWTGICFSIVLFLIMVGNITKISFAPFAPLFSNLAFFLFLFLTMKENLRPILINFSGIISLGIFLAIFLPVRRNLE